MLMPSMENSCRGTTEKPVIKSKLRRMSEYQEYLDSPSRRGSWATSISVGSRAYR